jgi:TonB family protein
MIPFLALIGAGLVSSSESRSAHPPAHRAHGNLAQYFNDSDYPHDAIQRNEQGVTGFTLDVDAAGRVSACRVTKSSGSASLDEATCRIAQERVRLEPARDRRGRPVPDRVDSRMRWVLPEPEKTRAQTNLASYISDADYPAAAIRAGEQGTTGFRLFIGPDGLVTDCRIIASSGSASLDEATCRIMRTRARFRPAHDANGNPVPDTVSSRVRWVLPADEVDLTPYIVSADYPAQALPRRAFAQVEVQLNVSAEGRVTQCLVIRPSYSAALDARTCEIAQARAHFLPARDAADHPIPEVIEAVANWGTSAP